jgi:hypothetical protein
MRGKGTLFSFSISVLFPVLALGAEGKIRLQAVPETLSTVVQSAPTLGSDLTFVLPSSYGGSGKVLTTDGSGSLSLSSVNGNSFLNCEFSIGGPDSTQTISNGSDSPGLCGNKYGKPLTITAVECYTDGGSPSVRPQITGGSTSSILSSTLSCGVGSFAAGTLNGTPIQAVGQSIDMEVAAGSSSSHHIIIRISRTLP